jgi:DNA-directed RNA polymerase specialized sigma24 family protein
MTNEKRDATILKLWLRGWTYRRISDRYDISISRVTQIIAARRASIRRAA